MTARGVLQFLDTNSGIYGRFLSLICPIEHCAQSLHSLVRGSRSFAFRIADAANMSRRHHGDWFCAVLSRDFIQSATLPIARADQLADFPKIASSLRTITPPKILEPRRRQLGIAHRVLDVLVPEISLKGSLRRLKISNNSSSSALVNLFTTKHPSKRSLIKYKPLRHIRIG